MTDDERALLANAYLDDEATVDERAHVDDDVELRAEVDRLRAIRAVVADVPAARVSVREQHLAAAFGAWERIPSERDATPGGTPRRGRSQTSANRWMLAAAAGLVVVVAGGLALRDLTDRDDATNDASDEIAAEAVADTEAPTSDDGAVNEDELRALSEAVESAEAADAPPATPEPGTADLDTEPLADEQASAPPPDDDLVVLLTSQDLASFAASALTADGDLAAANADAIEAADDSAGELPADAQTIPPADEESLGVADLPLCPPGDVNVGPALFGDVAVVVAVDADRRWALAFAIEDCDVLARALLSSAD